ncbi:MAG: hypothetical protein ACLVAT_05270 [Lachnospiraceae bacterium]
MRIRWQPEDISWSTLLAHWLEQFFLSLQGNHFQNGWLSGVETKENYCGWILPNTAGTDHDPILLVSSALLSWEI